MASILKYPGAKNKLAKWIFSYIPEHSVYVEPFFGSGAVFFNKKPVAEETIYMNYKPIIQAQLQF